MDMRRSTHFNILRGSDRQIQRESVKLAGIGRNGISRYDVCSHDDQAHLEDFYYAIHEQDFAGKGFASVTDGDGDDGMGPLNDKRPLFTHRGLQNHSRLPQGDPRLLRAATHYHEDFKNPKNRAYYRPRNDHIQDDEMVDEDQDLGHFQKHIVTAAGHKKTSAAAGKLKSSIGKALKKHKGKDILLASMHTIARMGDRRRTYRETVEHSDPSHLDHLETLMRTKLAQYARGPSQTVLHNKFRFFDRRARGGIDIVDFTEGLKMMTLEFSEEEIIGLFARYDKRQVGHISYYEFIDNVLAKDLIPKEAQEELALAVTRTIRYMRHKNADTDPLYQEFEGKHAPDEPARHRGDTMSFGDDDASRMDESVSPSKRSMGGHTMGSSQRRPKNPKSHEDTHHLTDVEFWKRQNVRTIFHTLDSDESGFISIDEVGTLLKKLGVKVDREELHLIFDFMDPDGSGQVEFDEFYHWYTQGDEEAHERLAQGHDPIEHAKFHLDSTKTGVIWQGFNLPSEGVY